MSVVIKSRDVDHGLRSNDGKKHWKASLAYLTLIMSDFNIRGLESETNKSYTFSFSSVNELDDKFNYQHDE